MLVVWLVLLCAVTIHAVNVELTSTKTRQFTCPGDQVMFTCRVFGSSSLEWHSLLITEEIRYTASSIPSVILNRGPFNATLTNVSGMNTPLNANFTSTLQVTASRMFLRNETTVMCLSSNANKTDNFTVAELPSVQNVTVNQVDRVSGSVTITASWIRSPNYELFDIDRYDINVSSTSGIQQMTTTCGECTNITITVAEDPSNVRLSTTFTITISVRNRCGENGPTAAASHTLIDCGPPDAPQRGSTNFTGTTEGSVVFYSCDPGLVPEGRMNATCTDSGWSPNPAGLNCTEGASGLSEGAKAGIVIGVIVLVLVAVVVFIVVGIICYKKDLWTLVTSKDLNTSACHELYSSTLEENKESAISQEANGSQEHPQEGNDSKEHPVEPGAHGVFSPEANGSQEHPQEGNDSKEHPVEPGAHGVFSPGGNDSQEHPVEPGAHCVSFSGGGEAAQTAPEDEIKKLQEEKQALENELKDKHARELRELREQHTNELQELKNEMKTLRTENKEMKERMEKMEREHSAQLAEMERKHGKETQDLKLCLQTCYQQQCKLLQDHTKAISEHKRDMMEMKEMLQKMMEKNNHPEEQERPSENEAVMKMKQKCDPQDKPANSNKNFGGSIHTAAKRDDLNTIKNHVDKGADINIKDDNGWTPLHIAAAQGNVNTVDYLLKRGANVNINDNEGMTPLHFAAKQDEVRTMKCLADNGADIDIKDVNGCTPLHIAAKEGHMHVVTFLVEKQANIDVTDNDGETPLHFAATEGNMDAAQFLIHNGADVNIKDKDGMSPLDVATEGGHVEIEEIIKRAKEQTLKQGN